MYLSITTTNKYIPHIIRGGEGERREERGLNLSLYRCPLDREDQRKEFKRKGEIPA